MNRLKTVDLGLVEMVSGPVTLMDENGREYSVGIGRITPENAAEILAHHHAT